MITYILIFFNIIIMTLMNYQVILSREWVFLLVLVINAVLTTHQAELSQLQVGES